MKRVVTELWAAALRKLRDDEVPGDGGGGVGRWGVGGGWGLGAVPPSSPPEKTREQTVLV